MAAACFSVSKLPFSRLKTQKNRLAGLRPAPPTGADRPARTPQRSDYTSAWGPRPELMRLAFAAVMAAAEARAFLQARLHTLNPVCRTQGELSGKVPKSVCSAVFSMENACSSVQDVKFF